MSSLSKAEMIRVASRARRSSRHSSRRTSRSTAPESDLGPGEPEWQPPSCDHHLSHNSHPATPVRQVHPARPRPRRSSTRPTRANPEPVRAAPLPHPARQDCPPTARPQSPPQLGTPRRLSLECAALTPSTPSPLQSPQPRLQEHSHSGPSDGFWTPASHRPSPDPSFRKSAVHQRETRYIQSWL